jgi:hypothetical protein
MFNDDENIKNYFVYEYHFLDDLSAVLRPIEVYSWFGITDTKENKKKIDKTVKEVRELFLRNGWEGDGQIGVIWVPPFIDIGFDEDTWGSYLWHVKQSNNGTSFFASPIPLKLKRLQEQNDEISINDYRNMEPINIIQNSAEGFLKRLDKEKKMFDEEINILEKEKDEVSKNILEKLLGYTQCDLIAQFIDFLNDCYLSILIEVLRDGNKSKIKLRKSAVKIDLSKHNHHEIGITDEEGANWMSLQMFITDIWHSYMFEPFDEKYRRLTSSLDYAATQVKRDFLFKHVVIRNCIQHHDWQLDANSLKVIGKEKIEISTESKPIEIVKWKIIQLTKTEIILLFDNLNLFVKEFNKHVDKRVMTRHYRPRDKTKKYIVTK